VTELSLHDFSSSGPRCPTCGEPISWRDNPNRPFCSATCRLVDLGQWLDEQFEIPGKELSAADATVPE
jgi:endogenous inhibitor of DNA gyrase (YacG/DUF329 family)